MKRRVFEVEVNGEMIRNLLYLPDHGDSRGMVIFCHGFPGTNRLPRLREVLTQQGIILAEVGYRGDRGSEGKFSFLGSIEDIHRSCLWLNSTFSSLKKCLLGYSAGGFYLLNLIHDYGQLADSIILLNPAVDPALFLDQRIVSVLWPIAQKLLSLYESDFYQREVQLLQKKFNPFKFIDEIPGPITVLQSENDEVVSVDVVKEFCRRVSFAELLLIKDKPHHLDGDEAELVQVLINPTHRKD